MRSDIWIVVLAAGAGRRLAAVTGGVPKQFWRPHGQASSLLEETLGRMRPLAPRERTMTVVDESHQPFVGAAQPLGHMGEVIYQPEDRGTAVGVLMPLVRVHQQNPNAIVVLTPSDHGVEDSLGFQTSISRAIARVQAGRHDIVLVGVAAITANQDYGWITPTTPGHPAEFRDVEAFVEKPPAAEAERLLRSGGVWNTMVLVARVGALLSAFERTLPHQTRTIVSAAGRVRNSASSDHLRTAYRNLAAADFSRDVLARTRPLTLLTLPAATGWSDLGTPDRLHHWLSRRAVHAA